MTLEIADVDPKKAEITLTADKLTFKGESNGTMYELECEFWKPVKPDDEKTKYAVKPRNVQFHIVKAEEDEEYWPFLMKDKALSKRLTSTDWSKWKDDDEEQEEFDTTGMGGVSVCLSIVSCPTVCAAAPVFHPLTSIQRKTTNDQT